MWLPTAPRLDQPSSAFVACTAFLSRLSRLASDRSSSPFFLLGGCTRLIVDWLGGAGAGPGTDAPSVAPPGCVVTFPGRAATSTDDSGTAGSSCASTWKNTEQAALKAV